MAGSEAAIQRQSEVYVGGMAGRTPAIPVDVRELEEEARRAMSREAYAYVAGGAGSESTVRANRDAFERWRIVPRMLRDVSERDTSVELFGRTLPAPLLMAPIGVLELLRNWIADFELTMGLAGCRSVARSGGRRWCGRDPLLLEND